MWKDAPSLISQFCTLISIFFTCCKLMKLATQFGPMDWPSLKVKCGCSTLLGGRRRRHPRQIQSQKAATNSCFRHGACSQWKRKWKYVQLAANGPPPLWEPPTSTPITVPVRKAKGEVRVRLRIRTGIRFRTCTWPLKVECTLMRQEVS